MRVLITEGVQLWLSQLDTEEWAHRTNAFWPESQLSGKRLYAEFDHRGDLVSQEVNGEEGVDVDILEFNAITSDFLKDRLSADHPAYDTAVGQHLEET